MMKNKESFVRESMSNNDNKFYKKEQIGNINQLKKSSIESNRYNNVSRDKV